MFLVIFFYNIHATYGGGGGSESILVNSFKLLSAGVASTGLSGAGVGIGLIFMGYMLSFSRNPLIRSDLFSSLILGFALVEAMALFSLLVSFLLLFAF